MQHDLRHDCTLHRRCGSITERTNILIVITVISQVDGRPPCVNGVITIQWEWSNFDPSKNQNPLTDDDKTLHNWLRPRDKRVSQNLCQMAVRVRLGKYVKYNTNNFFFFPRLTYWSDPWADFHAQRLKLRAITQGSAFLGSARWPTTCRGSNSPKNPPQIGKR